MFLKKKITKNKEKSFALVLCGQFQFFNTATNFNLNQFSDLCDFNFVSFEETMALSRILLDVKYLLFCSQHEMPILGYLDMVPSQKSGNICHLVASKLIAMRSHCMG